MSADHRSPAVSFRSCSPPGQVAPYGLQSDAHIPPDAYTHIAASYGFGWVRLPHPTRCEDYPCGPTRCAHRSHPLCNPVRPAHPPTRPTHAWPPSRLLLTAPCMAPLPLPHRRRFT